MGVSNLVLKTERGLGDPGTTTLGDKSRFANVCTLTAVTTLKLPSGAYCHVFNGTSSLITVTAAKCLSPFGKSGIWSASAWIKPTTDGEGDLGSIYSQATGWYLRVREEATSTVKLEGLIDQATDANAISSTTMTTGVWHHVAMVYNRLGTMKIELYCDGALMTLGTDTAGVGAIVDGSASALILGNNVGTTNTFDGSIAWWGVSADAQSAGQMLTAYNREKFWFGR